MHLVAANSSASCDAQSKDAQPSEATPKLVSVGLTPAAWLHPKVLASVFIGFVFRLSLALAGLFRTIIEDALHLSRQ